jgi:hypothetical protein
MNVPAVAVQTPDRQEEHTGSINFWMGKAKREFPIPYTVFNQLETFNVFHLFVVAQLVPVLDLYMSMKVDNIFTAAFHSTCSQDLLHTEKVFQVIRWFPDMALVVTVHRVTRTTHHTRNPFRPDGPPHPLVKFPIRPQFCAPQR